MSLTNIYDYVHSEFFTATDLKQPITGTGIVRLYDNEEGKTSLSFASVSLVLRDAPSGGGNLLILDTDYTLEIPDDYYSEKEGFSISRGFKITNASYQSVNLYASGYIIGSFVSKDYVDTKASLVDIIEISSDTTLTSAGVYKVTAFCNITLPASLEINEIIEIYAKSACRLYQGDAENVVIVPGLATTKGITSTPIDDGTKYVDLKLGTHIILTYKGAGRYSGKIGTLIGGLPGALVRGVDCAWNPDGNYLATTTGGSSPPAQWWKRTGDTMSLIDNIPDQTYGQRLSWSPDGNYLAITNGVASPYAQWYKRTGDTLTLIGTIPSMNSNGLDIEWSPCGNYLVITHSSLVPSAQWWKRTGDILVLIGTIPSVASTATSVSWCPNGRYFAITTSGVSPYVQWWKRTGDTLTYLGGLTGASNYGLGLGWSPCGNYLAVATSSYGVYAQWYKRTGDKLTLIGTIPQSLIYAGQIAWSPCGNYLIVANGTTSPYIQWYKRTGDALTYLGSPTGAISSSILSWSPDGNYLAVTTSTTSPYVQWYKMTSDADKIYQIVQCDSDSSQAIDYNSLLK